MGLLLVKNHIHIIFSTKNRIHFLHPSVDNELHNYMVAFAITFNARIFAWVDLRIMFIYCVCCQKKLH